MGLVFASAFLPWAEWSFREGDAEEVEREDLFGPPSFVPGTPSGSIEMLGQDRTAVDWSVAIYTVLLLVSVASWLLPLFRILSRRLNVLKAILLVDTIGTLSCAGAALLLGLPRFAIGRFVLLSPIRSTRSIEVTLARIRLEGPLILSAGVLLAIGTLMWTIRMLRHNQPDI
jgi:hypothetical protein